MSKGNEEYNLYKTKTKAKIENKIYTIQNKAEIFLTNELNFEFVFENFEFGKILIFTMFAGFAGFGSLVVGAAS